RPLDQVEPSIPRDLVAICQKAMARRPEDRYPTALELADDLRRFQAGQLVGAHRYSARDLFFRFVRRHLAILIVVSAALVVLAIGGGYSVRRIVEERDRARDAQSIAENARRKEVERHDELVLVQARHALELDPTASLAWLERLSPDTTRARAARIIAE